MKTLLPFFKGYWQTAVPFYILLLLLEYIKPGFVQSRVQMTMFFVTILIVLFLDILGDKSTTHQER